ncbi:MAG: hypothetical protein Q4F31_10280 [Eubacteriales bacterium]|nr:hypothetical protein [Eubacteriales bacterium]
MPEPAERFLMIPHASPERIYPIPIRDLSPFQISDQASGKFYTLGYRFCIEGVYGIGYVRPVGSNAIQICVFYPINMNCA